MEPVDASVSDGKKMAAVGMEKAWTAEGEEWKGLAWEVLIELASTGQGFNADDIREKLGEPARANAMGALFSKAKRRGIIHVVGFRPMRNRRAHARTTFVYAGQ